MTEKAMIEALEKWNREGENFFREDKDNFLKVAQAHNYVFEKGLENCSDSLQKVYREALKQSEAWADSLPEPTPAQVREMREELNAFAKKHNLQCG